MTSSEERREVAARLRAEVKMREKFPDTDSIERHVGPLRQG